MSITPPLPPYTDNQRKILYYLYQFRFLHIYHIQKLCNHKDPRRVRAWLTDLINKNYLTSYYDQSVLPHKPTVYALTKLARKALKRDENVDLDVLNLVYRKEKLSEQFREHHLCIADMYQYFVSQQKSGDTLNFFTNYELRSYTYFSHPLPDAYIEVVGKKETNRYFLEVFDSHTPPFVYEKRVKKYIAYFDTNQWHENTEGADSPIVLFVCPDENIKQKILKFGRTQIGSRFDLYIGIKTKVCANNKTEWEDINS